MSKISNNHVFQELFLFSNFSSVKIDRNSINNITNTHLYIFNLLKIHVQIWWQLHLFLGLKNNFRFVGTPLMIAKILNWKYFSGVDSGGSVSKFSTFDSSLFFDSCLAHGRSIGRRRQRSDSSKLAFMWRTSTYMQHIPNTYFLIINERKKAILKKK